MTKPIAKQKTVGKDFSVLKPEGPYCDFCAKGAHEVQFIIAGAMVFICDECVFSALDILHEEGIKRDGNKRGWMKVGKQIGDAIRNRRKRT